jgi:hypothetical protein
VVNNGTQNERGVAIFCSSNVNIEKLNLDQFLTTIPDLNNIESGRLLAAKIVTEDLECTLFNVYAPNEAQSRQVLLRAMKSLIRQIDGLYILAGD